MADSIRVRHWVLPWASVVVLCGSSFSILEAELGLSIHKVRGRGYQLAAPLTLLDPAEIERSGAFLQLARPGLRLNRLH